MPIKFSNLRVGSKLWLAIATFVASLLIAIGNAGMNSNKLRYKSEVLTLESTAKIKMVSQWAGLAENVNTRMLASTVNGDADIQATFREQNAADEVKIAEIQKRLEEMPLTAAERLQIAKILEKRKVVLEQLKSFAEAKASGDAQKASTLFKQGLIPATMEYVNALHDQVSLQELVIKQRRAKLTEETGGILNGVVALLVLVVVAALFGAHFLVWSIRQPLDEAVKIANRIAHGDLSIHTDSARQDEFGDLMRALEKMNTSLSSLVSQVRANANSVVTTSGEIASGNLDLSARTEQQASALEETASSMEELTSTVKQNADNARQANSLATSASEVALKGGQVVSQVIGTMAEINASSEKIVDIISVIDGIAFQTNILALNAAVEAARAGDQGRGFAVVAAEVRNLAQRSAAAAKEIKALIENSVHKVSLGTELVDQAGSTMTEIVDSIRRVTDIMGEIQAASQEQTTGIEQINRAIADMDHSTQQNAALVEEAASASRSMQDEANSLAQAVSVFKINDIEVLSSPIASLPTSSPTDIAKLSGRVIF